MPSSPKTFRVFVSSTFTDMRAERRVLQERVFPDLKKYCEARGAAFQAVDLRWGVNEESQREQKTMEICLTEIARCQRLSPRPNFIVLLGDRYGWQPVPNKIPAAEMVELRPHLLTAEDDFIFDWYREDTNALPAEYVLKPWGEDYRDYDQWQPVEDKLRAALRKAVIKAGFTAEQRIKYFASATHQEIINGALQPPPGVFDPAGHVVAYLRQMDSPPQGDKAGDYLDPDPDAKGKLDALKEELIGKLPKGHICKYPAQWDEGAQFDKEAFADKVYQDLVSVINEELQKISAVDELTREKQLQTEFAQRLTRFFTGQEEPRRRIAAYLKQGSGKPLALIGPSGSGKSSLMAQALEDARQGFSGVMVYRFIGATTTSSNPLLMLRQVCEEIAGAFNISLRDLLREGEDEKRLGTHYGVSQIFSRCLALASENQPLFIFLDALDQLQDQRCDFLPHNLPEHARIAVSALPEVEDKLAFAEVYRLPLMTEEDGEALLSAWLAEEKRRLTKRQWQEVIGRFKENGLPLYLRLAFEQARQWHSYDEGKVLPDDVDGILAGYFKLLEKEHTPELVGKVAGYLMCGKYHGLAEAEILDLLVFDREYWESFVKGSHPAHRDEIEKLERLPFVVWSRLFLDLEPYLTERDADGVPIISFYHGKFREYATKRYLDLDVVEQFHTTLARYFETRPLYLDAAEQAPNVRKVVEQPYQETLAGRWESLADNSLADFPFLMAKAKAAIVEGILEDYALAFEKLPQEWREKLKFWEAFFRERAHILRRGNEEWPAYKILLQLAMEHADDSPVTQAAERYLTAGKFDWPWLRRERRLKHAGLDPCLAVLEGMASGALALPDERILSWGYKTLKLWDQSGRPLAIFEGHTDWVQGALALPDGRFLSWSDDSTLRLWDRVGKPLSVLTGHTSVKGALSLPDGRILSWSNDTTLRLWDSAGTPITMLGGHTHYVNGALSLPDERILSWSSDATLRLWDRAGNFLAILAGHTHWVKGALMLPDGRILSWSDDKTLRIWNWEGKPLAILLGHTDGVKGALVLPDGRILSWSHDKTLRLWDQGGNPFLEGHTRFVEGALVLSDGRILSWSGDNTLRLWDRAGRPLAVLQGHTNEVQGALALPDGRILSWSLDNTLRLWDPAGKPLAVLQGHTNSIWGALALPDRRILSWSWDNTLRLWDLSGKPHSILEGHADRVVNALAIPDVRILSWSWDNTLRLWDRAGNPIAVLEGHTNSIWGTLALPDGRILSWAVYENTFRLWDRVGKLLAVLEGHTAHVTGALALPDGRLLSWSYDETPRLWDRVGKPLAALEGHTAPVEGVLTLPDSRLLSWSLDYTLRLWDSAGTPLAVLEGHTSFVRGALALPDERILSWSDDKTLRLWDRSGKPLAVLDGQTSVKGAQVLPDGRILIWSYDKTLRLWDRSGKPLAVLKGHTNEVQGALALPDGCILSWSWYVLRLWHKEGKPLEVYRLDEGLRLYPETRRAFYGPNRVYGNVYLIEKDSYVLLADNHRPAIVWHGASRCMARLLYPDGWAVVTQDNGQVCVLQLYHGNRRITLDDLEGELADFQPPKPRAPMA